MSIFGPRVSTFRSSDFVLEGFLWMFFAISSIWRMSFSAARGYTISYSGGAMMNDLQKPDNDQICRQNLTKASERLGKFLSEADIRLLIGSMVQKKGADMAEKDGKREQNMLFKQMERNKRKAEKQKKRVELEMQKEKLHHEKELKRLQDEAENPN